MFPTIHDANGNDLKTQGYGALSDCTRCEVVEELNGEFTLELTCAKKGAFVEYLQPRNIIVAKPNAIQKKQPFRIYQIRKSLKDSIIVYARHISYDLSGYPCLSAVSYNNLADTISAMNNVSYNIGDAIYHQFVFHTDKTSNMRFQMSGAQSLRSWMGGQEGSIIDTYGGEWEYDDFECFLKNKRGEDTGLRISYGHNLAEYLKERNDGQYSHICAYYVGTEENSEIIASDLIPTGLITVFKVGYIDVSSDYENTKPTVAQLNANATSYINSHNFTDSQTITITPAQLENKLVGLGDSVLVSYDGEVISTRIIKTVWDVLGDKYKTLTLGTKQANIVDTIKSLSSSSDGTRIKSKQYSGTLNSYGCIQTDLKPEKIIIDAKTISGTSFQCTPLIAGGWWWIRAVDWTTGNKGSGSITVTVDYV